MGAVASRPGQGWKRRRGPHRGAGDHYPANGWMAEKGRSLSIAALPVISFLLLWQVAPSAGLVSSTTVPTPTAVLEKMAELTLSGELVSNIAISLGRVLFGLAVAIAIALPLGFLLGGWFRSVDRAISPLLQFLSFANPFTLFPVFITLLGIGELSKVIIIFWVCLWPLLFGTISGIKSTDASLVKVARSYGLTRLQIFEKVLLPSAAPSIFVNLRLSVVLAFFMLIGAEMIGASSGLGYMILQSCPFHFESFQLEKMWAGIVTVALLGMLVNRAILEMEKRTIRWKEEFND
jgi:NitT/TauT family transport system permease protein